MNFLLVPTAFDGCCNKTANTLTGEVQLQGLPVGNFGILDGTEILELQKM